MLFGRAGYLYAVLFTRAVLQDPAFGAAEARATIAEILDRERLEFIWHGKRSPRTSSCARQLGKGAASSPDKTDLGWFRIPKLNHW